MIPIRASSGFTSIFFMPMARIKSKALEEVSRSTRRSPISFLRPYTKSFIAYSAIYACVSFRVIQDEVHLSSTRLALTNFVHLIIGTLTDIKRDSGGIVRISGIF